MADYVRNHSSYNAILRNLYVVEPTPDHDPDELDDGLFSGTGHLSETKAENRAILRPRSDPGVKLESLFRGRMHRSVAWNLPRETSSILEQRRDLETLHVSNGDLEW